ncbi:MAG: exonuclease domain-containing protein, partial [Endomicrobia bacterium]|nr:exonuclease domain-containing protein [Endomicrobiia bacterium]
GDRDVDGITSVTILLRALTTLGGNVIWYIPQTEGYGLHKEVLEKYIGEVKLVITADCGISAIDEVQFLLKNNIDVIITDHHEPDKNIVNQFKALNVPVINPYLEEYKGFRHLAGAGVVLKFVTALIMSYDEKYYNKIFVVLDIETTGLSPYGDEICEIALLKLKNFLPIESFHSLVKPSKPIPDSVSKLHGITNNMVESAPGIEQILPKILNFIKEHTLVIHNADFDLSFLNFVMKKFEYPTINNEIVDTLSMVKMYHLPTSYSLEALASYFMFENKPTHRAIEDVLATAELFYYLYFMSNHKLRIFIEKNLYFASLGTISDLVPLIEDNRIIVKKFTENIFDINLPPFKVILDYLINYKKRDEINAEVFSWDIIPLLNAAGRMQKVEFAINFLTAKTLSEAEFYFQKLKELNNQRKVLQNTNLSIFSELVEQQCDLQKDIILLIVAEKIEHGVTGIVANYMLKEFNRPLILLILDNGTATGTARSPKGINIYSLLKQCEHLFEKFGGHENACGISIKKENIPFLREELKKLEKEITLIPPIVEIDAELHYSEFNLAFYKYLYLLEPCGAENPYPIFLIKNVKVIDYKYFGKNSQYSMINFEFSSSPEKLIIPAVCWDIPEIGNILQNFLYFDIIGELELNPVDKKNLRFVLLDLQPVF